MRSITPTIGRVLGALLLGALLAGCGAGAPQPPAPTSIPTALPTPSPTPDEAAALGAEADRLLGALERAVRGEPIPAGVGLAMRARIRELVGEPTAGTGIRVFRPERPVYWRVFRVPFPGYEGYDPEATRLLRATFRGGRVETTWAGARAGDDLEGKTCTVVFERRGGAWEPTRLRLGGLLYIPDED